MATIGVLVKNRQKLSAIIKQYDQERKDQITLWKQDLEKIDNAIMKHLNDQEVDSVKTEAGTAYKATTDRVNVSDSAAFKKHIVCSLLISLQPWRYMDSEGQWQPSIDGQGPGDVLLNEDYERAIESDAMGLLTISANKNSCKEYMNENEGKMPNGVNYTTFIDIKVRKN